VGTPTEKVNVFGKLFSLVFHIINSTDLINKSLKVWYCEKVTSLPLFQNLEFS